MSSDPRTAVAEREGASHSAGAFSAWPEPVGWLAATRDPDSPRRFGDTVRQEFGAVGIRLLLGPQVDIVDRAPLGAHQRHLGRRPADSPVG